ncbi:hypothetical protein [Celeribacter ethanolicus]|nr:hypothetical protein [Celeribacter ethanolicus]
MSEHVAKHRRSWGRMALIAVLGLSLLGNAMTFGVVWRFQQVRGSVMGDAGPETVKVPTFPREIRKALRAGFVADEALQQSLREAIEARRAVVAVSTEEPFDKAATEAAMAEFRARFIASVDELQDLVLEVIEAEAAKD